MSKVTLTKGQAKAIENAKMTVSDDNLVIEKVKSIVNFDRFTDPGLIELNELTTDTLIKALYIGYEVEEMFEVGDWVVSKGIVGKIINEYKGYRTNGDFCLDVSTLRPYKKDIERHATPEEIAEEKQRRFWHKNDREVWELKEEDVLEYLGDPYIVDWFDSENVSFGEGPIEYMESFDFVKEHFKVFCFAEDRKDIKHD